MMPEGVPEGYRYVVVTTGVSDGDFIEITSGLNEGDEVAYIADTGETGSFMYGMGMMPAGSVTVVEGPRGGQAYSAGPVPGR